MTGNLFYVLFLLYIVHGSDLLGEVLCGDVEYVGVGGGGEEVGQRLRLGVPGTDNFTTITL